MYVFVHVFNTQLDDERGGHQNGLYSTSTADRANRHGIPERGKCSRPPEVGVCTVCE